MGTRNDFTIIAIPKGISRTGEKMVILGVERGHVTGETLFLNQGGGSRLQKKNGGDSKRMRRTEKKVAAQKREIR